MGFNYSKGKEKVTLTEAMGTSRAFLGVITHNYVEDMRSKDTRIMKELQAAKDFNVPVVLFYFESLTPENRKFAEESFKDYRVVKTFDCPYEHFGEWLKIHTPEISQAIMEACKDI